MEEWERFVGRGWECSGVIFDGQRGGGRHAGPSAWARSEIRQVVRAVITDVTCVEDFDDDDDFVRDIGIG